MSNTTDLSWLAHRKDGKKDGIMGVLPSFPVCQIILAAHQKAAGLERKEINVLDEDGNPTGETETIMEVVRDADGDDLVAVGYAALGACWQQPPVADAPTLRGCGRDVVEYGEQFQTAMLRAGYKVDGMMDNALVVLDALRDSVYDLLGVVAEEEESFGEAQEPS